MRLLITGAAGMLGQDVGAVGTAAGLDTVSLARAELDIANRDAVDAAVSRLRPDAIINCAAWTDVDAAEEHEPDALAVNSTGAGNLARAAAAAGAWTIQVSSDYVFDGAKREPYLESDSTSPLSAYGRTKLAGEREVELAAPDSHTIVRTSWLYGTGGRCFPQTIMRLAAERDELRVVDDQLGCPTFTAHLATALVELAVAGRPLGVIHVAGGGSCSWFELALAVVELAGLDCEVGPCTTSEMPRPATRPAYGVLGTERRAEAPSLPVWRQGIEQYVALAVPAP
jgi:dTDP-4-dehydrorhamnose reductase